MFRSSGSPEGSGHEEPDPARPEGPSRRAVAVFVVVGIALLVLIVLLHLSGVIGPGVH